MIATTGFVQKAFDRFNALCFEGSLPAVPIVLTRAGSFLGKMESRTRSDCFGRTVSRCDFRLKISTGFDLPENELEDVVIHEMIHYYIYLNGIDDTSSHGKVFRSMMERINREYGRHLTISHHGKAGQNLVRVNRMTRHYFCITTFPDGVNGITVCASTRLVEIRRLILRHFRTDKLEFYVSMDPFFGRYPRSITPKLYKITDEELSEHLQNAQPIKF